MPPPVVTVTLDGIDITDDVHAPEGQSTLRWGRGANFDGSGESPGYAIVSVLNNTKRFSPYNASSPLASSLRVGKRIHVSAVYSAVTYHPFDGFLTRITQDPDTGFAELHATDLLGVAKRREAPLIMSGSRTLRSFRGAILDGLGVPSADQSLGSGYGEAVVPYTGADAQPAASTLDSINAASGSIHFVRGKSGGYEYVAIDRATLQAAAVAETFSDSDFTQPFAETLGALDYTEEGLINRALVDASPRVIASSEVELWRLTTDPSLAAGQTLTIWAEWSSPATSVRSSYVATGAPTVTVDAYARTARITITAGATAATVSAMALFGFPLEDFAYTVQVVSEELDAASQTTYGLRSYRLRRPPSDPSTRQTAGAMYTGTISAELVGSVAAAAGLGSWLVYRYRDVRARPPVTMVNRLPSQLVRDVGDRVAVTSAQLSTAAAEFWIRGLETTIESHGATWRTSYDLEAAPPLVDIVTVGGTAAQGVGGTAILGY